MTKKPGLTIFLATLVAGTLDIAAACIQFYIKQSSAGKPGPPGAVLRYIASGVFGKKAFGKEAKMAGIPSAAWGLFFHYVIAFFLVLFFFRTYPRVAAMRKNKVVTGLLYGIFAWVVTALVVVPLSNVPPRGGFTLEGVSKAIAILMVCIGLPIAFIVGRYHDRKLRTF